MVSRTLSKGLVVIALTSQVAFGASYGEAALTKVKDVGNMVTTAVAKRCSASKDSVVHMRKVVASKAHDGYVVACQATGHITDGCAKAGMTVYGGAARQWAQHRDAYIVGLTLTGVAAIYAAYKYRKACKAQRQLEELKKQGYVK